MHRKLKHLLAGIIVLCAVAFSQSLRAQGASDLRINEVLVNNVSNFTDEYGQRSGWIEIVNASFSYVELGGCYLTDDKEIPTKYWIPNDSPDTKLAPRGFALFFGDGKPTRGIFHLNFKLEEGETIYLFDANGKTLIDQLTIPSEMPVDAAFARVEIDGDKWEISDYTTPRSDNDHSRKASAGERFVQEDPSGAGMVVIAMTVVFFVLAILVVFYLWIGRFFKKQKTTGEKAAVADDSKKPSSAHLSGETNAAIAMALYLYQAEQHDYENTVLTIKKVSKAYSPWSSKIYTLRKYPRQ